MKREQKRTFFGVTKSKRAWNNVLVYVVLLIMFLLYFVLPGNRQALTENSANVEVVGLIPAEMRLLSIHIDDQVIERQPDGWVCVPVCAISKQRAAALAETWQSLRMIPSSLQPEAKIVDVYLYFEGDQQARIELYSEPKLLIKLPQQDRVFEPVDVAVEALLGR